MKDETKGAKRRVILFFTVIISVTSAIALVKIRDDTQSGRQHRGETKVTVQHK